MKILLLTRYDRRGSSSMVRMYQYLPFFKEQGWEVIEHPLLSKNYLSYLEEDTPIPYTEIIKSYMKRISILQSKRNYDLIWLQQEAFPWFPEVIERFLVGSDIPYLVDYDDALFHRYDMHNLGLVRSILGKKIDSVMKNARVVLAGNEYLALRARKNNAPQIEIIPTVVDYNRFFVGPEPENKKFSIGWLGSPATAKYLYIIQDELKQFCNENNSRLVVVGSKDLVLDGFDVDIRKWADEREVRDVQSFDVGIMPLPDNPWERGKCGFKLIQYMACGKPVVASPVGVNSEIVKHGENGFIAENSSDWLKYFTILKNDSGLRKRMGDAGRKLVEEKYSLQVTAPYLLNIFKNLIE